MIYKFEKYIAMLIIKKKTQNQERENITINATEIQ